MQLRAIIIGMTALLMAFHLFFGGLVLETMAEVPGGSLALFVYRIVSLSVVGAGCLWLVLDGRDFYLPAFWWFLLLLIPFGAIVGIAHGHSAGAGLNHVVQGMTSVIGFVAGYLLMRRGLDLGSVFRVSGYVIFGAVVAFMLIFFAWAWAGGDEVRHYSLDFFGLIIPLAYFLAVRRLWWALSTLILMALVGKRAIALAGLAMVLWWCIEARWRETRLAQVRGNPRDLLAVLAVLVVIAGWVVSLHPFGVGTSPTIAASDIAVAGPKEPHNAPGLTPISPNYMVERYTDFSDLNKMSGMRGDMLSSVVELMNSRPFQWWTGAGFGSSYVFSHSGGTVQVQMWGVDIMPAHLAMLYGVPAALIILGFIAWVMLRGWVAVRTSLSSDDRSTKVALVAVLIGYMVCSMFTYASVDPTFWFFLGTAAFLFQPARLASLTPSRA